MSLGDLYLASGEQLLYDSETGELISMGMDDIKGAKGQREVLRVRACKKDGEYALNVTVGRRKAGR